MAPDDSLDEDGGYRLMEGYALLERINLFPHGEMDRAAPVSNTLSVPLGRIWIMVWLAMVSSGDP
jgi:hypothetical protein